MKIQDIAEKIGYADGLDFSRSFSKVYGMSPKQYRKEKLV
jgi:AraC-like DNA-binding protein